MTIELALDESERQVVLLAIGRLAAERPGWAWMLGKLAEKLGGRDMFEHFNQLRIEEMASSPPELAEVARDVALAGLEVQRTSSLPAATPAECSLTINLGRLLGHFLRTGVIKA